MNYKALIIEDEMNNAKFLNYLVDSYSSSIEVIGIAIDLQEAKNMIVKKKPDIIFLDIELGNNNGFEIFKTINPNDFQIIFTTAHEDYAIDAIKVSAVDYLIKPINVEEFITATQRAIVNLSRQISPVRDNVEISYQKNSESKLTDGRLSIPCKNELNIIKMDTIIYLKADGKYTIFGLICGRELLSSLNIGYFEKILSSERFLRVHNTYLINLDYIQKIVKGEGYYCVMVNNLSVPVSRRKYQPLREALGI